MGVISCRSKEASSMPNYIRVKATAKCCCRIVTVLMYISSTAHSAECYETRAVIAVPYKTVP